MIEDLLSAYVICGGFALLLTAAVGIQWIADRFSRTYRLKKMIEKSIGGGKCIKKLKAN